MTLYIIVGVVSFVIGFFIGAFVCVVAYDIEEKPRIQ